MRFITPDSTSTPLPVDAIAASLGNTSVGLAILDSHFQLQYHNMALSHLLGLPDQEKLYADDILNTLELDNQQLVRIAKIVNKSSQWQSTYLSNSLSNNRVLNVCIVSLNEFDSDSIDCRYLLEVSDCTTIHNAPVTPAVTDNEKEKDQLLSEFISGISHDLRTPLHAITGFSQLLFEDDTLSEDSRMHLKEIMAASDKLLAFINEQIALSKRNHDDLRINEELVNLATLFQECITQLEPIATSAGIDMSFDAVEKEFLGDKVKLKRVLINLLSNAVRYNRHGGRVVMKSYAVEDRLRIEVADSGKGISPAFQERILHPFRSLAEPANGVEGIGLGVMFSRKIADAMKGQMNILSHEGIGSLFWLDLPRKNIQAQEVSSGTGRQYRLILIDSHTDAGHFLNQLSEYCNFREYHWFGSALEFRENAPEMDSETLVLFIRREGDESITDASDLVQKNDENLLKKGAFLAVDTTIGSECTNEATRTAFLTHRDSKKDMPRISEFLHNHLFGI